MAGPGLALQGYKRDKTLFSDWRHSVAKGRAIWRRQAGREGDLQRGDVWFFTLCTSPFLPDDTAVS